MNKNRKKNILILGGYGELGFYLLNQLYKNDFNIVFSYKTKKINKIIKIDKNKKCILFGVKCDISKELNIKKLLNLAYKKLKYIDCIINCTGVFYYDDFKKIKYSDLYYMFKINCFSTILINKYILRKKNQSDSVKIITCGSSSATMGSKDTVSYCASKHALLGTVRSLNQSYIKYKIFNYCLNFGTLNNKKGKMIKNINNQKLINQKDIFDTINYLMNIGEIGIPEDLYLKRII